jgi:hypothetical protein
MAFTYVFVTLDFKPRKGNAMFNSLFSCGKDFKSNACLNYSLDSMGHCILGYRIAADFLAHKVDESGSDQDYRED